MQDTVYSLFQKYNCLRMSQVKGLMKDIMSSDEAEAKVSDLLLQGKIICVDNKYFGLTGNVDTALVKTIDIMLILSRPYKLILHNHGFPHCTLYYKTQSQAGIKSYCIISVRKKHEWQDTRKLDFLAQSNILIFMLEDIRQMVHMQRYKNSVYAVKSDGKYKFYVDKGGKNEL